jgi:hypothetical protein
MALSSTAVITSRFNVLLGSHRGTESNEDPEDGGVLAPPAFPTAKQRTVYGWRAEAAVAYMLLVPSLPAPQPTPVWLKSGLQEGCKHSELTKASEQDWESWTILNGYVHEHWKMFNPTHRPDRPAWMTLSVGCLLEIGAWLAVYPDLLSADQRQFLELAWRTLMPTAPYSLS